MGGAKFSILNGGGGGRGKGGAFVAFVKREALMKQYKVEITKRSFAGYGRYMQLCCYEF